MKVKRMKAILAQLDDNDEIECFDNSDDSVRGIDSTEVRHVITESGIKIGQSKLILILDY